MDIIRQHMSGQEKDIWLTEKQLAEKLNCSLSLLQKRRHLCKGPPYIKIGRSVRYSASDVEKYLESCRITHTV